MACSSKDPAILFESFEELRLISHNEALFADVSSTHSDTERVTLSRKLSKPL